MANDPKSNPGGDAERVSAESASGGQKTGYMRWVLGIGTALAVAALLIVSMVISR
ncbi:MAG: hypothetical protein Q8L66_07580 [Caulobacter sp.]|nr:hypothetical protein [Caulobacter sp.]